MAREDGPPTPAYRLLDLYIPDYDDTACAAVATTAAAALFPSIFGVAAGAGGS